MQSKGKNLIAALVFIVILLAFVICASRVTMPKRYELGANWGAFVAEPQDSMDVVFFGSSLAYCNVIPAVIWQDSGLSSYVMAGPEQTAAATYYYVKEMFRHQSPTAIMVEASAIHYAAATGQDAVKINLGYLPYDLTRLQATFKAAPREQWLGLLFPLYNYHDRWPSLSADDYRLGLLGYDVDPLRGYHFLDEVEPQQQPRQRSFEQQPEDYAANLYWLLQIAQLCQTQDCRCIFYISGSNAYFAADYLARLQADLTQDGAAEFIDCMAERERFAPDPNLDFMDVLHFNYRGAQKYSLYLSQKLAELGVSPKRPYADSQRWQSDIAALEQKIQAGSNE